MWLQKMCNSIWTYNTENQAPFIELPCLALYLIAQYLGQSESILILNFTK